MSGTECRVQLRLNLYHRRSVRAASLQIRPAVVLLVVFRPPGQGLAHGDTRMLGDPFAHFPCIRCAGVWKIAVATRVFPESVGRSGELARFCGRLAASVLSGGFFEWSVPRFVLQR